jgi:lipopolysaccharide biosynthesis glycosyltransferase
VYFDFDVIFERDIAELWNMELGEAWMLAAHDPERVWSRAKKSYYLKALDIDEGRYFNSGVLLMNLKALREASRNGNVFWKAYIDGAEKFCTLRFTVFDQDLLNYLLSRDHEKLLLTDASFNYELCLGDRRFLHLKDMKGRILHFPALKPWEKFFPAQLVYWKYYSKTPWADEVFPLIEERMFDPTDRIWPFLMRLWRSHASLRWLARLRGSR